MSRQLFELAAKDPKVRFSPFCWRARLALEHKGLSFDTVAWRFTEKERIAFADSERVPVLVDGDDTVSDSFAIARYLETTYPDAPALEAASAAASFIQNWTDGVLMGAIFPIMFFDIYERLDEADQPYFRESREQRFGVALETFCEGIDEKKARLLQVAAPLEATLADHDFVGGSSPTYADFIVASPFLSARAMCPHDLEAGLPHIAAWIDRLRTRHPSIDEHTRPA